MRFLARKTLGLSLCFLIICISLAAAQQSNPNDQAQQVQMVRVTQGPVITYADDQFAVISWSTNVSTESRVFYGTDPSNLNQVAESLTSGATHRLDLRDLRPDTVYYFQVDTGLSGTETQPTSQFRTVAAGAPPLREVRPAQAVSAQPAASSGVTITRGPTIEYADDRSAVISWTTSDPAGTVVYYGTDPNDLGHTAESASGTAFHRVHLSDLSPGTTYYFLVDSGQARQTGQVNDFQTTASGAPPIHGQQPALAARSRTPVLGPRPSQTEASRPGKEVPAGAEIHATLQQELSTKTTRAGDHFTAIVTDPVRAADGSVAIPAGSKIDGEVVQSEQGKTVPLLRGRGKMDFQFRNLVLSDGTIVPFQASLVSVHNTQASEEGQVQSRTSGGTVAKDVGIGAGLGTIAGLIFGSALKGLAIGAIVGGGYVLATKGKDVEIPAHAGMKLRLDQNLYVPANTAGR